MNILLDTNIYIQDLMFQKPEFKVMLDYLGKTNSFLLLPDTVAREVSKHIGRKAFEDTRTLRSTYAAKLAMVDEAITREKVEENLKGKFDSAMTRAPLRPLKHTNLKVDDLLERSLKEMPPFQPSDKGLRDTIIWLNLIQFLRDHPKESVALITANSADFGKGELHEGLLTELSEAELADRVVYFNSIGDFLSVYEKPIAYIDDEFITKAIDQYVDDQASDIDEDDLEIELEYQYRDIDHTVDYVDYDGYDLDRYYVYSSNEVEYVVYVEVVANYAVGVTYSDNTYKYNYSTDDYDYEQIYEKKHTSAHKYFDFMVHVDRETKKVTKVG